MHDHVSVLSAAAPVVGAGDRVARSGPAASSAPAQEAICTS